MADIHPVLTSVESSAFERVRPVYLDEGEYTERQQFMVQNPEVGEVVSGSGGIRKLRRKRAGTGERGGPRVIYSVRYDPNEFWMLSIYAKAKSVNIPAHTLSRLLEAFRND